MKYNPHFLIILAIPILCYQCNNDSFKPKVRENLVISVQKDDCIIENEILNQIFPFLLDSLNSISEIRNGTVLCYGDSIIKPWIEYFEMKSQFYKAGMQIDTIILDKENSCKLTIQSDFLKNGIELRSIGSSMEYLELRNNDPLHYLLISFTRVCSNKLMDKGFFIFSVMTTPSSGKVFSVLIEKTNNNWQIRRINEIGII